MLIPRSVIPRNMTIAELNTLYSAAVSALDSGDYATAISKAMAMQVRLATTPNLTRNLGGGGSQAIAWTSESIAEFIAQARRLQSAARAAASGGPFQTTKVTYKRATT